MTKISMKREFPFDSNSVSDTTESKRLNIFHLPVLKPIQVSKRPFEKIMEDNVKRQHIETNTWEENDEPICLPDSIVRDLAFSCERRHDLPYSIIQKMEEEAYKQSPAYRQQALTLYRNIEENNAQGEVERDKEEYLGSVSYYYPPLPIGMDIIPIPNLEYNFEEEESTIDYQAQMMQTGMMGMTPMNWSI